MQFHSSLTYCCSLHTVLICSLCFRVYFFCVRREKVLNCIKKSHHEVNTALIRERREEKIVKEDGGKQEDSDAVNGNELTMSTACGRAL